MTTTAFKDEARLARGLGWFSIGLGLAAFLAPRGIARLIGVKRHHGLIRLIGLREITSGVGILSLPAPDRWVQSRVGGDVMDLALLGGALISSGTDKSKVAVATTAVAGITALDVMCSKQMAQHPENGRALQSSHFIKTIVINRSPQDLFEFWRKLENLPLFMKNLKTVTVTGPRQSHWVALAPGQTSIEWDSEITEEVPNQSISWRSLPGSKVQHQGTVRFQGLPAGRGTIVKVELEYHPPGGGLGVGLAKLLGQAPEAMVMSDLRRLKQIIETGEIPTTEGQPAGRKSSISRRFDKYARSLAEV